MIPEAKRQLIALCSDPELGPLLVKVAMSDKEKTVKIAACKALYGLEQTGVLNANERRKLKEEFSKLKDCKRARRNLEEAVIQYNAERKYLSAAAERGGEEQNGRDVSWRDNQKDLPRKPRTNVTTTVNRTGTTVNKQRPNARSRGIIGGAGGKLGKGVTRHCTMANIKRPKCIEGQPINPKSREDNRKALAASTKFTKLRFAAAMQKFQSLKQNSPDMGRLQRTAKITDRIQEVEYLAKEIQKRNDYKLFPPDAIISWATESMGWEGSSARSPTLAKVFLNLLDKAMANGKVDKRDTGMFTIYLSWALERLQEQNTCKLATRCLLSTCYQYTPKVVLSAIEKLLLEPEDPSKSPFKNGM